jgi:hypothetical protein
VDQLFVLLLLACQEAYAVGLLHSRQQGGAQRTLRADDLVPTRRVQARNGAGDELLGDARIEFIWHGDLSSPLAASIQHGGFASKAGEAGEMGVSVVVYAIEVVAAVRAVGAVGAVGCAMAGAFAGVGY